jgi:hypothetical protein
VPRTLGTSAAWVRCASRHAVALQACTLRPQRVVAISFSARSQWKHSGVGLPGLPKNRPTFPLFDFGDCLGEHLCRRPCICCCFPGLDQSGQRYCTGRQEACRPSASSAALLRSCCELWRGLKGRCGGRAAQPHALQRPGGCLPLITAIQEVACIMDNKSHSIKHP